MILRPQPRATFEPPRAGATRGAWNAWFTFLRRTRLRLPRVPLVLHASNLSWRSVAVVVVPTYGWVALGKPSTARWAALAYGVSAVIAIVCLGWAAAGWAAGVMITIHGLGIAEYFYSGLLSPQPRHRIARSVAVVVVLAVAYTIASRRLLTAVVVPVQTDRGVVLINNWASSHSVAAEEIVAFRSEEWRAAGFRLPAGVYLGRVMGQAGDVITFQADTFAVKGHARPRRPFMPKAGKLTVPPGHVFIWPLELRTEFRNQEDAMNFALKVAIRPDANVVGRAYSRWFWRKQTYEPVR